MTKTEDAVLRKILRILEEPVVPRDHDTYERARLANSTDFSIGWHSAYKSFKERIDFLLKSDSGKLRSYADPEFPED